MQTQREDGRKFLVFVVYLATLLDNILLTVIVPILPDYLSQIKDNSSSSPSSSNDQSQEIINYKNLYFQYISKMFNSNNEQINSSLPANFHFDVKSDKLWTNNKLNDENGAVGILLATKALIQMLSTPFVKSLTNSFGYRIPTIFGTFVLFLASSVFAIGKTYFWLLFARAMHGFASACISICGMSLIAQIYPEEKTRSQMIGIVLGSMALGVLLGYPFGGILYFLFNGKSALFFVISMLTFLVLALQILHMNLECTISEKFTVKSTNYMQLLGDSLIAKIAAAIFISTIAMSTLEPCLPIWLMANLKPKKWQIGTVFIPDSIGYFVSTTFFATLTHRVGGMQIAVVALSVVGFSCLLIPHANSISSLILPHFALGVGIGCLDVALVPLLASIVDSKYIYDDDTTSVTSNGSSYSGIYAIQQISVGMAYFLGPLLGGEIAQYIGFTSLMSIIGVLNLCYGIYLMVTVLHIFQPKEHYMDGSSTENKPFSLHLWPNSSSASMSSNYKRFYDSVDGR